MAPHGAQTAAGRDTAEETASPDNCVVGVKEGRSLCMWGGPCLLIRAALRWAGEMLLSNQQHKYKNLH